jgi:hypothetical protein
MGNEGQDQNNQGGGKNKGGGGNQQKNGLSLSANIDAANVSGWEPIKASMSGAAKNALGFIIAGLFIGMTGPMIDKLFGVKPGAAVAAPPKPKPGQCAYELAQFKKENPEGFKAIESKFTDQIPANNEGKMHGR